jgi:hypothetical protein
MTCFSVLLQMGEGMRMFHVEHSEERAGLDGAQTAFNGLSALRLFHVEQKFSTSSRPQPV